MSIETELFTSLRALVSDRVYPNTFPEPIGGAAPTWPSIRYTLISGITIEDLCGDGDDATTDWDVQIDGVAATFSAMRTLRLAIMAAMRSNPTPARLQTSSDMYDEETKTHRAMLIYTVSGSSPDT